MLGRSTRSLSLVFVLVLVLTLAACGGTTAPAPGTTIPAASATVPVGSTGVPTSAPNSSPAPTTAATLAPATTAALATTTGSTVAAATGGAIGTTVPPAATTMTAMTAMSAPTKPTGPPDAVKVVHVPGLFFAPLYVAMDQGYFKEQNLDVQLSNAASGAEAVAFLAQGQIDVGAIGLSAATFNTLNKGFDFRVIASASLGPDKNSPTKLEVRSALVDGGIVHSVMDLKGRKIAVAGGTGSAGAYLATKVLQKEGVSAKDVTFVNLSNPDMIPALTNGAVDAALIGTPFATTAVDMGIARVLSGDLTPGYSTTTYTYGAKFLTDRPDAARRFTVALLKGYRAVQGSNYLSDTNVKTYVKYLGSPEKIIRDTPPLVYDPNMGIARESVIDQEKVYRESGWTDYKTPLDVEKLFDTSYVAYALKTLG